jgi:hypothetical protein
MGTCRENAYVTHHVGVVDYKRFVLRPRNLVSGENPPPYLKLHIARRCLPIINHGTAKGNQVIEALFIYVYAEIGAKLGALRGVLPLVDSYLKENQGGLRGGRESDEDIKPGLPVPARIFLIGLSLILCGAALIYVGIFRTAKAMIGTVLSRAGISLIILAYVIVGVCAFRGM